MSLVTQEPGRSLIEPSLASFRTRYESGQAQVVWTRTIADLAGAEKVGRTHIAEALGYRQMIGRG